MLKTLRSEENRDIIAPGMHVEKNILREGPKVCPGLTSQKNVCYWWLRTCLRMSGDDLPVENSMSVTLQRKYQSRARMVESPKSSVQITIIRSLWLPRVNGIGSFGVRFNVLRKHLEHSGLTITDLHMVGDEVKERQRSRGAHIVVAPLGVGELAQPHPRRLYLSPTPHKTL